MGPVACTEDRWADVHGGGTRRWPHARVLNELAVLRVHVFPDIDKARKAFGRQESASAAIEAEVEPRLIRLEGDRHLLPATLHGEEEMFVRRVKVPHVVGMVLVVPFHTACIDIESEGRISV